MIVCLYVILSVGYVLIRGLYRVFTVGSSPRMAVYGLCCDVSHKRLAGGEACNVGRAARGGQGKVPDFSEDTFIST